MSLNHETFEFTDETEATAVNKYVTDETLAKITSRAFLEHDIATMRAKIAYVRDEWSDNPHMIDVDKVDYQDSSGLVLQVSFYVPYSRRGLYEQLSEEIVIPVQAGIQDEVRAAHLKVIADAQEAVKLAEERLQAALKEYPHLSKGN